MLLQLLSTVISIHAPTRGATSAVLLLPVATSNFNPRSHEGSDQTSTQSILTILYFNPRSHEGSDIRPKRDRKCGCIFQSTLPRGERPKAIGVDVSKIISIHAPTRGATSRRFHPSKKRNYFNPRSHEGSDKAISCKNKRKCKISIHAPTRGATDINLSGIVATEISIHAPTRGATSCADKHSACSFYFNPRSHEGSDDRTRRAVV